MFTERHDGTLDISSEPGRGMIVTVTFPASRILRGTAQAVRAGSRAAQISPQSAC